MSSGTSSKAAPLRSAAIPGDLPGNFSSFALSSSANDLSPYFWGTTVSGRAKILPTELNLIAATPTQTIVWPGGSTGDAYDPITNTLHSPANGTVTTPPTNESEFISLCKELSCSAIFEVPGEIDKPQYAAEIVNYTEKVLKFHPAFWEIGNEPELWRHWQQNWSAWPALGPAISPVGFADEVQNYSLAMRAVDPTIRILGITATGRPNGNWNVTQWVNATVAVNGPNISGVAVHVYPAGPKNDPGVRLSLAMFYGLLNDPGGLPARVESIRSQVNATLAQYWPSDPGLSVPVFVTEIGSALAHKQYGQFAVNFGGAVGLAAMMTQGMALNVTNLDLFGAVMNTNNSWFDLNGTERPDYEAYSQLFTHLGPVAYPVTLSGFNSTLFGVATIDPNDGNRSDLLVVNANTTTAVNYTPRMPGKVPDSAVHFWYWNGTVEPGTTHQNTSWVVANTPAPVSEDLAGGLPAVQRIPAQGIELFEWYPSSASSVTLHTSGLPAGARWFAHVGPRFVTSNQTSLTLYLPNGNYSVSADPIPLPLGTRSAAPVEQLAGLPSSSIVVPITQSVSIAFFPQWRVTLVVDPNAAAGQIVPAVAWANASASLGLYAVPAWGYRFSHWFGWGPGSTNGTNPSTVIDPTGPVTERAYFEAAFEVNFTETGLPVGTSWAVELRGTNESSSKATISFAVPAVGLYGFRVASVPGYRALPPAGSLNVTTSLTTETITFQKRTGSPPTYPVTFQETGLPSGTNWSVTVRGATNSSTTSTIGFRSSNGTYGFEVGVVPGYRSEPTNSSYTVNGSALDVPVTFTLKTPPPPKYPVVFTESGLPTDTNWSVVVRNETRASTTPTISFSESNGTYGFEVGGVPGYRSQPTNSSCTVNGSAVNVAVTFTLKTPPPPRYPVVFTESGLPTNTSWSVVVRNETRASTTPTISFSEGNGTYGFNVSFVPGFRPVPRLGTFNVTGAGVNVSVTYLTLTPPPATYLVTFEESGLSGGTTWSVTVRNETVSSVTDRVQFYEPNGRYGYQVSVVSGYTRHPPSSGFTVAGAPVTVTIVFQLVRTEYRTVWKETGFWGNGSWWVVVNNVSFTPAGAWVTAFLPNGTYRYTVEDSTDFVPSPRTGAFEVKGTAPLMSVVFTEAKFLVLFTARGLPSGKLWTVRLSDNNSSTASATLAIARPNGTYTFDVEAPAGYYASPSHGNVTVRAAAVPVTITFVVNGPGPVPPMWYLTFRAAAVGVVIMLGAWGGFALMRAVRRGRDGPGLF